MKRLDATDKAIELIKQLKETHGELMFIRPADAAKEHSRNVLRKADFSHE